MRCSCQVALQVWHWVCLAHAKRRERAYERATLMSLVRLATVA
jgi:hypothetical protein